MTFPTEWKNTVHVPNRQPDFWYDLYHDRLSSSGIGLVSPSDYLEQTYQWPTHFTYTYLRNSNLHTPSRYIISSSIESRVCPPLSHLKIWRNQVEPFSDQTWLISHIKTWLNDTNPSQVEPFEEMKNHEHSPTQPDLGKLPDFTNLNSSAIWEGMISL